MTFYCCGLNVPLCSQLSHAGLWGTLCHYGASSSAEVVPPSLWERWRRSPLWPMFPLNIFCWGPTLLKLCWTWSLHCCRYRRPASPAPDLQCFQAQQPLCTLSKRSFLCSWHFQKWRLPFCVCGPLQLHCCGDILFHLTLAACSACSVLVSSSTLATNTAWSLLATCTAGSALVTSSTLAPYSTSVFMPPSTTQPGSPSLPLVHLDYTSLLDLSFWNVWKPLLKGGTMSLSMSVFLVLVSVFKKSYFAFYSYCSLLSSCFSSLCYLLCCHSFPHLLSNKFISSFFVPLLWLTRVCFYMLAFGTFLSRCHIQHNMNKCKLFFIGCVIWS